MQWRNIDYSVVQAAGRPVWKWKVDVSHRSIATRGEAKSRSLAVTAAVTAIERLAASELRKLTTAPASHETVRDKQPELLGQSR